MCGINGFVDREKKLGEGILKKSTDIIGHRGPDDSGYKLFHLPASTVGLGHRRLSVIDLSPLGHQPMFDESGKYAVIFNGEVYNYKEVRELLPNEIRRKLRSSSDTEIILYSLIHFGLKAVDSFIGMFALAFIDVEKEKLFLIRDRAGVKPLYYHFCGEKFLFSSELKSFHQYDFFKKDINHAAVKLFFQYGYIPAPHTVFMNTYKLLPGHYLEINCRSGESTLTKYWDVYDYYNQPKLMISEEEAIAETEKLLHSAFNYRMVSDVPVGVFFSGGYDSSTLAGILQSDATEKIKTFTIGFHEKDYNEAVHAKKVAEYLGTDHYEYYCTHEEAASIIPELPYFFDEPFGDVSAIPTILVSRFARKQVTVALSADAGDEIFGGYNRYGYLNKIQRNLRHFPSFLSGITSTMMNAVDVGKIPYLNEKPGITNRYRMLAEVIHTKDIFAHNIILSSKFNKKQIASLLKNGKNGSVTTFFDSLPDLKGHNDDMSKILGVDFKTYLPDDILVKVDRSAMSVALEGREPFIDHRIIEWVARLPIDLKIKNGNKKYLLKKIAERYIPAELLNRPKMGFGVPIKVWFKNELKELINEFLDEQTIKKHEFLNAAYISKLKKEYFNNPLEVEANKIWLPLMFQMWWKKWMD